MQLGKSLLGAIIGAAIGIAILLIIYRLFEIDGLWLAIPFALITGMGVRMLVRTGGHASYVRGALTMVLTLAAYIGGWLLVAQMATARANAPKAPPAAAMHDEKAGDAEKDADATDQAPPIMETKPQISMMESPKRTAIAQNQWSTWGFIWLAIAAFVAYEMGRGSEVAAGAYSAPSTEPVPGSTHPDA
jgi:hypothetical protein